MLILNIPTIYFININYNIKMSSHIHDTIQPNKNGIHIIKNINILKSKKLVQMIYYNFIDLKSYPELQHNKKEIQRLVTDKNAKIVLYIIDSKIAGYLIGEIKDILDGRRVFYISYIFTANNFRHQGIASKMLEYVELYTKHFKYDGILLTCNTEDDYIYNFYLMKGFMPDMTLRRYNKFDVLYKKI
jgi:ribosomal protein S18 acetylase RimI-like enzyme